jgi:gamma-tubulin complex component 3
LYLWV